MDESFVLESDPSTVFLRNLERVVDVVKYQTINPNATVNEAKGDGYFIDGKTRPGKFNPQAPFRLFDLKIRCLTIDINLS